MDTTRCAVQVEAGLIPGVPEMKFSKVWTLDSEEWDATEDADKEMLLINLAGPANFYAASLMLQPDRLNWVKTEWVWF